MNARFAIAVSLLLLAWFSGCSSGLGKNLPGNGAPPPATAASSNLPTGLDLGFVPSDPVAEPVVAGVRVPAIGGTAARDVLLVAFSTAAPSDNGDGAGTPLSRDATADTNAAADVFVAAISAQDIEQRAFSQSLAGKFRHPRCATCHSMQRSDTLAFVSAATVGEPHAGPAPGPTFPNNDPATCATCHVSSTAFPVDGWQAPAASFDIRSKTVAELAVMAQNVPAGETEHFVNDRRVRWALDSGILPTFGGRNGIADDNQNGIDEPEDHDGVPRTVPGGSTQFLSEIQAWRDSGMVVSTAAAVKDLTLVSRAAGTNNAGNGTSAAPRVLWVPNPGFTAASPAAAAASNPIGTLYVVFQSTAGNLVGTGGNGVQNVFRAAVELRAEEDANGNASPGSLNLRWLDSTVLCSARDGTTTAGNAASRRPVIGGANAQFVAFESLATDLTAFTDANGAAANDVYLRTIGVNQTQLVSHTIGNQAIGGSGASEAPAIDAAGRAIAFESDATDLVASDLNGVRDVFHATIGAGAPFMKVRSSVTSAGNEGTGGASSAASIWASAKGRILVAFQSDATDLTTSITAPTNVYLFDSATGGTTLLNQRLSPTGNAVGDGSARAPVINDNGATVAFESDARNIDVLRADGNRATDIFLVETGQLASGRVLPFRISLTATTGSDANGNSTRPSLGSFAGNSSYQVGYAAYTTQATNLGTSDTTNVMVSLLSETSGVFAEFSATPVRGPAPLQVQFTDASTGSPTSWAWDFDNDGVVDSTERNPVFVYSTPGTYTVTLVARNAVSEGSKTATDLVRALGPVVADFSASVASGVAPLSVTFTDLSTQSPTSWQWDFDNDGTVDSTEQNPTHVYNTPGTFSVRLVATNEVGSVEVVKTNLLQVFAPVVANFSRTPSSGIAPFSVSFTDLTTGSPTAWEWDFDGDGLVDSTQQNPTFNYTVAAVYDVTLTATGPGGTNSFTFVNCVTVNGAVSASFNISAPSGYTTSGINFTDTSTGTISSWAWDFDNNPATTESTLQNPMNVFFTSSSVTVYTVRLTVSGPGGTAFTTRTFTSVAASETATLVATQDTTIYSNNTGNGNGASPDLVVGTTYTAGYRRAIVQFDVSSIPSGSTVLTPTTMQLQDTTPTSNLPPQATGTQTFRFHRLTTGWSEGSGNASAGQGTATGASATFASIGSSFNPAFTTSITFAVPGGPVYTSGSLVADVQQWVNNPPTSTNNGWIILSTTETASTPGSPSATSTIKWFASSENPTFLKPTLTVTYRRPLP
ncbi:MAG TPA: PKD domain-containing protein [Planctomycetota bacterium]|nr:PKD domain-containing protein [Planctomycetota bacterium]